VLLTACDNDTGVTAFNASPEASITAPTEGEALFEGVAVALRGRVSDADNEASSLLTTWFVGSETLCAAAPPDDDGVTSCEATLDPDASLVTLEVVDPEGAAGSASVSVAVTPTDAPEATILAPEATGTFYSDQKITFEGLVSDAEDEPTLLMAAWQSDLDGGLDVSAEPDSEGNTLGSGLLTEGEHFLTLTVEDTTGKTGTDSVTLTVGPPNQAPTCTITAPEDGGSGAEGDLVTLEALVDDADVAADWLGVEWESDQDGVLASSTPNSDGTVGFTTRDLTVSTHVL
jgi:protocatechuate 3,4-dioxygenase beta subunit